MVSAKLLRTFFYETHVAAASRNPFAQVTTQYVNLNADLNQQYFGTLIDEKFCIFTFKQQFKENVSCITFIVFDDQAASIHFYPKTCRNNACKALRKLKWDHSFLN